MELSCAVARQAKNSDAGLIELFLDMLSAERGASRNTLAAYARDLTDFSEHVRAAQRSVADARTEDIRAFLGTLAKRGFAAAGPPVSGLCSSTWIYSQA